MSTEIDPIIANNYRGQAQFTGNTQAKHSVIIAANISVGGWLGNPGGNKKGRDLMPEYLFQA